MPSVSTSISTVCYTVPGIKCFCTSFESVVCASKVLLWFEKSSLLENCISPLTEWLQWMSETVTTSLEVSH